MKYSTDTDINDILISISTNMIIILNKQAICVFA